MESLLAEHGLALLAVLVCLVGTLALAPGLALLLSGSEYRDDFRLTVPLALGQALLVVAGGWWVVGSPGDWSLVLRSVAAGATLYAVFVTSYAALDDIHWRLGRGERRIWDPALPLGSAVVAVGPWWAIGVWLPLPLAMGLFVLLVGAAAWWWLHLLRGSARDHEEPRHRLTDSPTFLRAALSAASTTYAAWCDLDDAMPSGWTVGEPRFDVDTNAWELRAFDGAKLEQSECAEESSRPLEWTASAPTETEVIREMARRLRAIGDAIVPGGP